MSNRITTFASIQMMLLFASFVSAQPIVQYPGQQMVQQQPMSPAYQQMQYAEAAPMATVQQPTAAVLDPVQALEQKVNSLQYQLDTLRNSGGANLGCCSSTNCNGCGNNGCPKYRRGFYVGAAAFFAKPHFKEAFQHSRTNFATGQRTLVPFDYDYETTPRIWAGLRTEKGWGVRGTYWEFDGDGRTSTNVADGINVYGAHAVNIIFPANIFAAVPGETMVNSDSLRTEIQNYDVTYDAQVGSFEVSGRMGLRYAELRQSLNSTVLDATGNPIRQLTWQRDYDGLGPSASVDAKRRIGCTPLSIFASGGGAFLFGTKTIERTVLGDQSPQPAAPFLALEEADEVVGIGELGFGFEWSRWLPNGHQLTARGTYEGQLWADAGAPTLGFLGFEGFGAAVELRR